MILAVNTAGKTASAAVAQEGKLLGYRMVNTERFHSQILFPMAKELLAEIGQPVQKIDLFAAANGPGSYTGLRIGIAAMQSLAFAGGKQCAGISTLEGLAWNLCGRTGILCACMKARQELCYCAFFEGDGVQIKRMTEDALLSADAIAERILAYGETVMVIGDGAELLQSRCRFLAAPMHLCDPSACGICLAAMHSEPVSPEKLAARYLQEVKIG